MRTFILVQIFLVLVAIAINASAARLKDIANIRGVRSNQLVGYGLVVGLNGTGDGGNPFTARSLLRMLDKLGMKIPDGEVSSKNVAAVIVTADLPPFARAGNRIDINVNALGDSTSLKGGTLVQTPLRAADQQTYAVAQGSILVGFSQGGVHETVGRIPGGAMIEKDVGDEFLNRKMFRLTLHNPDFTTAARTAKTINRELAGKYATALDAATIDVVAPAPYEGKGVELLAVIEAVDIAPDQRAKVVVNERTGTVVIGHDVRISQVAISHGSLSLKVGGSEKSEKGDSGGASLVELNGTASVGDIVKAMNQLGVTPKDLITILQSIKASGALQGELEIL